MIALANRSFAPSLTEYFYFHLIVFLEPKVLLFNIDSILDLQEQVTQVHTRINALLFMTQGQSGVLSLGFGQDEKQDPKTVLKLECEHEECESNPLTSFDTTIDVATKILHSQNKKREATQMTPNPKPSFGANDADLDTIESAIPYMPEHLLPPPKNQAANSTHRLSRLHIQRASTMVKRFVESRLETDLNLVKHTAPVAFTTGTGVNDELDGSESKSPVKFVVPNRFVPRGIVDVRPTTKEDTKYQLSCEVVQSLAKWKRIMLDRLDCHIGEGIYCSSTSIRKGYKGDVTHSVIADQWDYEIRLGESHRTIETLKSYVRKIWRIITDCEDFILAQFPEILLQGHPTAEKRLPKEIAFISSQELHDMYPDLDVHGRENAIVEKLKAVFIVGMGWPMNDGTAAQEVRSPGYDDWNLNGDIMVQHPLTEYRHELSSQGIRVCRESMLAQLKHRGMSDFEAVPFYKAVIDGRLPPCYGGGIGISRLLMLLLRTGHIGEVQVGVWHDEHFRQAEAAGIDMIPDRLV